MQFRVIDTRTGVEADTKQIVFDAQKADEPWARNLISCDMEGWFIGEDGALWIADECGNYAYVPAKHFEIVMLNDDGTPQDERFVLRLHTVSCSLCQGDKAPFGKPDSPTCPACRGKKVLRWNRVEKRERSDANEDA
jgi:hypothetical protein